MGCSAASMPPSPTPPRSLAAARDALPDLPTEVLSLEPQGPRFIDECGVWNVGRADPAVHRPASSDVPVLLMTGTFDAVTPPSQADEAAKTLPHGKVVRFPGLGHGVLLRVGLRPPDRRRFPESTGQLRHRLRRRHAAAHLRELMVIALVEETVRAGRCWQEQRTSGIRPLHQ